MTKYVAFLRGVNVGGRVVKMADLKDCLQKVGLQNVKTILQSGNVIFDSDNMNSLVLKQQIEETLTKSFNYQAKVQVITLKNLQKIINSYPFGAVDASQHDYVIFMENGLEKPILKEAYTLPNDEKVAAGDGVVYWRVDKGSTLKSNFAKLLTKSKYRDFSSNRNLRTLQKIVAAAM